MKLWYGYLHVTPSCIDGHHKERVHIFSQHCHSLLAAARLSVLKVTSRGEKQPEERGRKEEEAAEGTGSRTQEVEKDEEPAETM